MRCLFQPIVKTLWSLALTGCLVYSLTASALDIHIAFDPKGDPKNLSLLNKVESHIKQGFPEASISVATLQSPTISPNPDRNDQIIVSLGSEALQQFSKYSPNIPIIAVFISRTSFLKQVTSYPDHSSIAAVFSDPSTIKQLALIRALYGDKTRVGYFLDNEDPYIDKIMDYAQQIGLTIDKLIYTYQTPKELLKNIDVLLLENNQALFHHISLDDLLYTTYDLNNTGIIGYSSGLVKSGAVATTYHALDDILNTLSTSLRQFSKTGELPQSTYPETYQLLFNHYVIRSLGLSKPSNEEIIGYINRHDREGKGL